MISIFCGTDTAKSRQQFLSKSTKVLEEVSTEIVRLTSTNLEEELTKSPHEVNLFLNKRLFLGENLLSKKKSRDLLLQYEAEKGMDLLIWEETYDSRSIKAYFKKSLVTVADLPDSMWGLLDSLQPGKKQIVTQQYSSMSQTVDEHLLLFMLQKRVKELLLVSKGFTGNKKMADWQISKLKRQYSSWKLDSLKSFYTKLYTIEKNSRLGTTPYSISQSLEILFCFYL